jgi:two-component system, sensor histidine kinase and response regulator
MSSETKGINSGSPSISNSNKDQGVIPMQENQIGHILSKLQKDFVWYSSLTEQINFCSESIQSVLGYTSEKIKSFNEKRLAITHNEDISRIREALNEFLTALSSDNIKLFYRLERKDNTFISVMEKIYAERDEKGEVTNLYGIVSDITEIQESEDRLFNMIGELQKLNEAKDKFVSRISHDLRSPFTSIIGFAEVLMNDSNIPDNDKHEYLNFILQSSKNLLHFVNQLNEIIKLQTNHIKLEPKRTNTNRLIHYSVSSFTAQIVDKNLEIKVNVKESIHINSDERLFLILITSLISNAVKFSKQRSKIIISAKDFNEDFVEIIVKDEGLGISENNKTRLFKMDQIFFSEGTKGEKGVGLGLMLSKEIVEKHGGNLWFYSNQNEGSEFHFTMPISKNAILIVENDSIARSSYEDLIKMNFSEFDVMNACDGYDALNMIATRIPSVIIVDHDLPLMTGLQMLENIYKAHKNIKISTMVLAENLSADLIKSYEDIGIKTILPKPISLKVLHKRIEELLSSNK